MSFIKLRLLRIEEGFKFQESGFRGQEDDLSETTGTDNSIFCLR